MKNIINHLKENWIKYGFETFVIIIGILGAFTLNSWNENRKERFQQELIVNQLLEDARVDSVFYNDRISGVRWVESTIHSATLLGEGKPVDSSMFRNHGKGRVFTMEYLHHASSVLDNNPDAYDKIISPEIKTKLRTYRKRFLYLERSFVIFNNILETDVKQLSKKYYKELRANKDLKSFDSLLKVYRDDDFQSIIDPMSRQVDRLNNRLTQILAANSELIKSLNDSLK